MRTLILTAFFIIPSLMAVAQEKTKALYKYVIDKRSHAISTTMVSLFSKSQSEASPSLKASLKSWQALSLGPGKRNTKAFFKTQPNSISLHVPYKNNGFQLELIKENISPGEFKPVIQRGKSTTEKGAPVKAVHYRGYIKNDPSSVASLSVFGNGDVMCLFSDSTGNYNLGPTSKGTCILYNDADMIQKPGYKCGTEEIPVVENAAVSNSQNFNTALAPNLICSKVRIYWEANYKLYNLRFGNNYTNTVNYLSGLFNQVSTLFLNEGIATELSEVLIWTTPDTFTTTSSATGLAAIRNRWNTTGNNFNGDLCMLIDGGTNNNGGRAYLLSGNICNRTFTYGYSNVYGSYNDVPAYSWDVEVVTHETGHNMGSNHTHWCGWNTGAGGTCGAIDNCSAIETTASCTSCSAATTTNPAPIGFSGSIMSYCHLRSGIGINLSNGFGALPGNKIRTVLTNSSCLVKGSTWIGMFDTAWENPGNWSCGTVPNSTTDVTIPEGLINYPVINSAAECRKIYQLPGSSVKINTEFSLKLFGTE